MNKISDRFADIFSVKAKDETIQDFYIRACSWLKLQLEDAISQNYQHGNDQILVDLKFLYERLHSLEKLQVERKTLYTLSEVEQIAKDFYDYGYDNDEIRSAHHLKKLKELNK